MTRSISEAATHYGWRFILLKPSSKAPYTPNGRHEYTDADPAPRASAEPQARS